MRHEQTAWPMDAPLPLLDYPAALDFLYGRINYERTPVSSARAEWLNLDRMHGLLQRLGRPHEQLKAVHVAGTKGKGSTATMVSSILTASGYRTGLYTSPHLERLEDAPRSMASQPRPRNSSTWPTSYGQSFGKWTDRRPPPATVQVPPSSHSRRRWRFCILSAVRWTSPCWRSEWGAA